MATNQVSADQAMQSPYYGIKGWLMVIYVLYVLSALSSLSSAVSSFASSDAMGMGIDPTMVSTLNFVQLALTLPFLILTPMKHRLMPMVSIACLWISVAIMLVFFVTSGSAVSAAMEQQMQMQGAAKGALPAGVTDAIIGFSMMFGLVIAVIFSAIVTWYLLASKRVNATFRHRLPSDMAGMPASGVPSHG